MILDKIENASMYVSIGSRLAKGLKYIQETDFSSLTPGKYEIDGENLFAIVSEYETKALSDCALEAHRKYIDIQYIISGSEIIGVNSLRNQAPSKAYDDKDDYALYSDDSSHLKMDAGKFAIFFPEDIHMPGVQIDSPQKIRKIIVKVRI
jgi:YhcH/YjgK/YiaL family protein